MKLITPHSPWGDEVQEIEGKKTENITSLNVRFVPSSLLKACFPYSPMTTNKRNRINADGAKTLKLNANKTKLSHISSEYHDPIEESKDTLIQVTFDRHLD